MTIDDLRQQRVGVLGYGQEGKAVIAYLLRHGIKPVLFDKNSELTAGNDVKTILGNSYLDKLNEVDVLFRSPGIWRLTPQLLTAEKNGLTVTSQVKWFFDHCPAPIIGVTGTKGKGTTASLTTHILKEEFSPEKIFLTGNIGQIQPLEIVDNLGPDNIVVYELSSFQLQDLSKSPHIGVVLMVTQDHLDVHSSLNEYIAAKQAVVQFQAATDFAIINDDNTASKAIGNLGAGVKLYFSRKHSVEKGSSIHDGKLEIRGIGDNDLSFDLAAVTLRGQHNWENISAAVLASLCAGATPEAITRALPTFHALPHRLQRLPGHSGIEFYDDSISTVPDTAQAAVQSFSEPLIVILGGSDKGADFEGLAKELASTAHIKAVAAIGTMGPVIVEALERNNFSKPLLQGFSNLEGTMKAIKNIALAGDVVLLSPACASFDWYANYKERGEDFIRLADKWQAL